MIEVRMLGCDEHGNDVLEGKFLLRDGAIVAEPADSPLLADILSQPVRDPGSGDLVGPRTPERWLQGLPYRYDSVYLRAQFSDDGRPEQEESPATAPAPVHLSEGPLFIAPPAWTPDPAAAALYDAMTAELDKILGGKP